MAAFSDYLETAILNSTLRGVAFPAPPTIVHVALFRSNPTDTNVGGELTVANSPGYARVPVPNAEWSAPVDGTGGAMVSRNTAAFEFPVATGAWAGPIIYFAIFDASTGGNMLYYGPLTVARTIYTGDVLRFGAGGLSVSVA